MSLNLLVFLVLVGGWLFGKIFDRFRLPSVLGMTIWGIIIALIAGGRLPPVLNELSPFLKSLALIIILLRAGLGISRRTLNKVGLPALLMSFVPCLLEGSTLMVLFHYISGFSWEIAGLTGFLLAAVSPAVVVPSMLNLKEEGYGRKNDVPTIILAGASLDDVMAITLFSIFLKLSQGRSPEILHSLLSVPLSLLGGIIPGILIGFFLVRIFNHSKQSEETEKALLLLGFSLLLLQVGEIIHTAALLGIMCMGFILLEKSDTVAKDLASKMNKAWVFAEIILFVLIGLSVDVRVAWKAGLSGILIISLGLVMRSLGVWIATMPSNLSKKERVFCMLAYIPKATVQAAMGSVPLAAGVLHGDLILAYAVLSILYTAPLGLFAIRFWGRKLLNTDPESAGA